jgi:hypothetical protein
VLEELLEALTGDGEEWREELVVGGTNSGGGASQACGEATGQAFYRRGERADAPILRPVGKGARAWGPRHGMAAAAGAGRGRRSVCGAWHAEGRAEGGSSTLVCARGTQSSRCAQVGVWMPRYSGDRAAFLPLTCFWPPFSHDFAT